MKTRQQKIEAWLVELENQDGRYPVGVDKAGNSYFSKSNVLRCVEDNILIAIVSKGKCILLPEFQDDQPEPKDKALQEYLNHDATRTFTQFQNMMNEVNERLKALEEK